MAGTVETSVAIERDRNAKQRRVQINLTIRGGGAPGSCNSCACWSVISFRHIPKNVQRQYVINHHSTPFLCAPPQKRLCPENAPLVIPGQRQQPATDSLGPSESVVCSGAAHSPRAAHFQPFMTPRQFSPLMLLCRQPQAQFHPANYLLRSPFPRSPQISTRLCNDISGTAGLRAPRDSGRYM